MPNLLATPRGRRWLFAILYLSEGAPVGFVWWALPTLLGDLGFEIDTITTLTTLATLPWVLKFLIAPAIDASLSRGVRARSWILACQLAMALCLLPLAWLDWQSSLGLLTLVIVSHAMFAAVQDVGIDTLAIRTVPADELGRVNGSMQAGVLLGRAGAAAGTTALVAWLDTPAAAIALLVAVIALPALVLVLGAREPRAEAAGTDAAFSWRTLLTAGTAAGMLVALGIGAGFEFFGVSAGPTLRDNGATAAALSVFLGLFAPGALAIGALAGGALCDRIGHIGGTVIGFAVVSATLVYVALTHLGALPGLAPAGLPGFTAVYLGIGLLTASSYALFMSLAQGPMAATRFSLFMAMTNACEAWAGFTGGQLAVSGRYGTALLILVAASALALLPLAWLATRGAFAVAVNLRPSRVR